MKKRMISNIGLIFITWYNLSYPTFVPNFIILSQVVAEKYLVVADKSLKEDVYMHYIGVRNEKKKKKI